MGSESKRFMGSSKAKKQIGSIKMKDTHEYEEIIICPGCGKYCCATVYADAPETELYHECEYCDKTITARDWEIWENQKLLEKLQNGN